MREYKIKKMFVFVLEKNNYYARMNYVHSEGDSFNRNEKLDKVIGWNTYSPYLFFGGFYGFIKR